MEDGVDVCAVEAVAGGVRGAGAGVGWGWGGGCGGGDLGAEGGLAGEEGLDGGGLRGHG